MQNQGYNRCRPLTAKNKEEIHDVRTVANVSKEADRIRVIGKMGKNVRINVCRIQAQR